MSTRFNIDEARKCVMEDVVGCYNCQPWDEGSPFWLGPHQRLYEILQACDIKRKYRQRVIEDLRCPRCGTDFTEVWDEVELKSVYDKQVEAILERAQSPELIERLSTFSNFLEYYPYLGLSDPRGLGKEIMDKITRWPTSHLNPRDWYRARKLDRESRIYKSEEMCVPDPEKVEVREGRFNHTGQSFLYLSNSPETAFLEVCHGDENICALQKFKATTKVTVLDLRFDYFSGIDPESDLIYITLIYNDTLTQKPSIGSSWKPEYFVPRFVADCARLCGYDGIWFSSAVKYGGENLVVFSPKLKVFIPEGDCEPFFFSAKKDIDVSGTRDEFQSLLEPD